MMDKDAKKNVRLGVYFQDKILLINKYIREETQTLYQRDTWFCVTIIKRGMKKISSGPQSSNGKAWSFQLRNKLEPVSTNMHK